MQRLVRRGAVRSFGEHGPSVAPIAPRKNGVRRASPARPLPSATHGPAGAPDCTPQPIVRGASGGEGRRMPPAPGPPADLKPTLRDFVLRLAIVFGIFLGVGLLSGPS